MDRNQTLVLGIVGTFLLVLLAGFGSGALQGLAVMQDGSTPLTANWNAGNWNISSQYFLANYSAVFGLLQDRYSFPLSDGVANDFLITDGNGVLSWVTPPVVGNFEYFLYDEASDIATYYNMSTTISPDPEVELSKLLVTDGYAMWNFSTKSGFPSITIMPEGVSVFHFHGHKTSTGNVVGWIYYEMYVRYGTGQEVLLATSENSSILAVAPSGFIIHSSITSPRAMNSSDRIILRLKAGRSGTGNLNIFLDIEGTTATHFAFPSPVVSTANFVPYSGATQNVDLGLFSINSTRFQVGANTYLDIDAGGNLILVDANTGQKTLAQLSAGGGGGGEAGINFIWRNGSNPLIANWNQGTFNLTNLNSWFLGKLNGSQILTGEVALTFLPTMDDAHIPDLETLSYGGAFNIAQIPTIPDSKLAEALEYLLRNGTRALTGNWATGGFDITGIGALTSDTLNTGQGAYELYAMDQDVEQADAVTFATLNTGEGANELFDMDQNVLMTSNVTFLRLSIGNSSYYIDHDTNGNLQFTDINTGTKTLAQLSAGGGGGEAGINFLWRNGSNPLIGNWAVGGFDITGIGALTSTTLDTGQGANELYAMNQDVETTDEVTFANVTSTSHVFGLNIFSNANQPINSKGFSFSTIQGAVNNLSGSGWVYAPSGTWSPVVIEADDVILFGAGWSTIIDGGVTSHGVNATGDRIIIRDLQAKTTGGQGNNYAGIHFTGVDTTVENVFVSDSDWYGIRSFGDRGKVVNSYVNNSDTIGILASSPSAIFDQNHVLNSGSHGIVLGSGGDNSVCTSNYIDTTVNDGVFINFAGENCLVVGNRITNYGDLAVDDQSGTSTVASNETT